MLGDIDVLGVDLHPTLRITVFYRSQRPGNTRSTLVILYHKIKVNSGVRKTLMRGEPPPCKPPLQVKAKVNIDVRRL